MSFLGYGSQPNGGQSYMGYPSTSQSQSNAYAKSAWDAGFNQDFARGEAIPQDKIEQAMQRMYSTPGAGGALAANQAYRPDYGNDYAGGASNMPGSGYSSRFGEALPYSNSRPLTVQGNTNIINRYGKSDINFDPTAVDPFITTTYKPIGTYDRQLGSYYHQVNGPGGGGGLASSLADYNTPLTQAFKGWRASSTNPYTENRELVGGKFVPGSTNVIERGINNFDDLNNVFSHMTPQQLANADQYKTQAFNQAAMQYANAFANKDYSAQMLADQAAGLGAPDHSATPAIDPSLLFNKQNTSNWLQSSYGLLMNRLNDNYLL